MIRRYDSLAAVADAIIPKHLDDHSRVGECGTAAECLEHARHGDTRMVAAAEKLIDQLSLEFEVPNREVISDLAGAWPSVPDFLAGHPDCMRRRAQVESEASPIAIWVCIGVSWNVTPGQMRARGTAILALVLALSRIRPITLNVFAMSDIDGGSDDGCVVAPINATPLDIATAAWALTAPAAFRRLFYGMCRQLFRTEGLFPDAYHRGSTAYLRDLLIRLGGDPDKDLIIDAARGSDKLIDDSIAWVKEQAARYGVAA